MNLGNQVELTNLSWRARMDNCARNGSNSKMDVSVALSSEFLKDLMALETMASRRLKIYWKREEVLITYSWKQPVWLIQVHARGWHDLGPIASIFWLDEEIQSAVYLDGMILSFNSQESLPSLTRNTFNLWDARVLSHLVATRSSQGRFEYKWGYTVGIAYVLGHWHARQLALADRIMINKMDLISTKEADAIENRILWLLPDIL